MAPPLLEPLLATNAAIALVGFVALVWLGCIVLIYRTSHGGSDRDTRSRILPGTIWMLVGAVPLLLSAGRLTGVWPWEPSYWEPLWFAASTGFSFAVLTRDLAISLGKATPYVDALVQRSWLFACGGLALVLCVWWYVQSNWYYDHFLLGFNDFAHFTQRIANTAEGRGVLLETPVLPMFWDHFNPGLLLIVPLWKLVPTVHLIFLIQSFCLASSGILIAGIARKLEQPPLAALFWGLAWLVQPAVGQFNVAYTYGWHPITIAIPLLLASFLLLLCEKKWWALGVLLIAMSMEEGVIVVVALFSFTAAVAPWLVRNSSDDTLANHNAFQLRSRTWIAIGFFCSALFLLVYRLSGIADFQTGRFVALGDNAIEVVLSPVMRPAAFWPELFKPLNAYYLLSLFLPCSLLALGRGWRYLLAVVLPLGVLLVWDHIPATCLGFQYASAILPVIWIAALSGAGKEEESSVRFSSNALATGLVLSLFVGQLPYSSPSIVDIVGRTYGVEQTESRGPTTELGQWLRAQVAEIRSEGGSVLATGRIASHLVGNRDVETVGQYIYRRPQLNDLPDRAGEPIAAYEWIIVDRGEAVQQTADEISRVLQEADASGFRTAASLEQIVVLRRDSRPQ